MKTLNISTLNPDKVRPCEPDAQRIVLRRSDYKGEARFYLMHPNAEGFTKLWETKSLHYASHSHQFAVVGRGLLQLSLGICLRLYSVSDAIAIHREFAGKYLLNLPVAGDFSKEMIVPV